MSHLRSCTSCNRHVLSTDVACPFCAAALDIDARAPAALPRLGRAALIAFAASAVACGGESRPVPTEPTTTSTASASAAPTTDLGTAPSASAAATATATATATASAVASAAAPADAGAVKDAGAAKDAGKPKTAVTATATATVHNMAKPYGAPPARDRIVV
jgi:hypothetical protein